MSQAVGEAIDHTNSVFDPIRDDFANFDVAVEDCLDLPGILEELGIAEGEEVSLFAFRSKRRAIADMGVVLETDEKVVGAVEGAEGFIHYSPRDFLSYCVWRSIHHARAALANSKDHGDAVRLAPKTYESMQLTWANLTRLIGGEVEYVEVSQQVVSY